MKNALLITFILFSLHASAQVFEWVRVINGFSYLNEVQTDVNGDIVAVGDFTNAIDVDPGVGTTTFTSAGSYDGLVVKLNAAGDLEWARQTSGVQSVRHYGMTLDSQGNVYVYGSFNGTVDFDPGPGVFEMIATGNNNTYLLKLNADGNFEWAYKTLAFFFDITVDADDNLLFTGTFSNTVDFDPGTSALNLSSEGSSDGFVSKLTSDGTLIWAKVFGGANPDKGNGIAVNTVGEVYVIGDFFNDVVDFDPGIGVAELTSLGATDTFILKLDVDGNFVWVNQIGGLLDQKGRTISVDPSGDVIATGTFNDVVDFDSGPGEFIMDGELVQNMYFTKVDGNGGFIWAKEIESAPQITVTYSAQIDNLGNIYTCGEFANWADFDPSDDTAILESIGSTDGYVYKVDGSGNYDWAKQMDLGRDLSIFVDDNANIFGCGTSTLGTDFNPGPGVFTAPAAGGFIRKLSPCSPNASTINVFACDTYAAPSGNLTYTQSGIYLDTLTNINCCDSVITINLTLNTSSSSSIFESVCDSYLSPSGNFVWDTPGIYNDTIPNVMGCDSVITVHLSILSTSSNIDIVACESYTSPSGLFTWTASGEYFDVIPNVVNCDSLITINLTIGNPSSFAFDVEACDSYTVPSGNETYFESGIYFDTIPTQLGCDSLLTINLTVYISTSSSIDVTACGSYTAPSGNETFTQSGIYTDIVTNSAGCDSLITIDLEVITLDLTISQNQNEITVLEPDAEYVWVSCPAMTPIEGATSQAFYPLQDGDYAVEVTANGCTETSECFSYIYSGVNDEVDRLKPTIYPNPSQGQFIIDFGQPLVEVSISIYDFTGRKIYGHMIGFAEQHEMKLTDAMGVYWLVIEAKGKHAVTKFAVE